MVYDAGIGILVSVLVLFPPAVVVFFMRVYVRYFRHVWGLDDWSMVLAMPFFCWMAAACIKGAYDGLGWHSAHIRNATEAQKVDMMKDWFGFECSYIISVWFIKLSIAYMIVRVARPQRTYVYSFYAIMAFFTFKNVGALIYVFVNCQPLSKTWHPSAPAINIVTDWACVLIPIPLISRLQMHRSSKIAAWLLLTAGSGASICALIRLKYTHALVDTQDIPYHYGQFIIWAWTETAVGLMAACCGTLRPLIPLIPCIPTPTYPSTSPSISLPTPLKRLVHHAQGPARTHPPNHASHASHSSCTVPSRRPTFTPATSPPGTALSGPTSPFDDPLHRGQSNTSTVIEGGVLSAMTWERDLERQGRGQGVGAAGGRTRSGSESAEPEAGVRINHHFEAISETVTPEVRARVSG